MQDLGVKESQKTLYDDIKKCFDLVIDENFMADKVNFIETTEKVHGRIETRRYWIAEEVDWLSGIESWLDLTSIGVVESERHEISTGITSIDRRYYIASIKKDEKLFSSAVRKHWGIENSLNWCLDVTFREDDSRIRQGYAAQNMAVVRHIALNFLKKEKSKMSVRGKRKKAGWDNDYMIKVLADVIG